MPDQNPRPMGRCRTSRRPTRTRGRTALALAAAWVVALPAALAPAPGLALDHSWIGGSGAWDDPSRWNPVGVPGPSDRALIASGNASLDVAAVVGGLLMSGGTVSGSGSLTVTGASGLLAGTLTGPGTTRFESSLAMTGNSLRTISGGRTVELLGATDWGGNTAAGSGDVRFDTGGGVIVNHGAWTDGHAFNVTLGSGPAITDKRFLNFGSYTKTGAGITEAQVGFDNHGAVIVEAGRLALRGAADSTSTGSFHIAAGATLSFGIGRGSVGLATLDGVSFGGSGRLLVDANDSSPVDLRLLGSSRHGGLLEVAAGQFDIAGRFDVASFLQGGGAVQGDGLLVVEGPASWFTGSQAGAGTTRFDGALTIGAHPAGTSGKSLAGGRVVQTHGDTSWGGGTAANTTRISINVAATLVNHGAWTDHNAFDTSLGGGTSGSAKHFLNHGSYTKTGAGHTDLNVAFANNGTVAVEAGRLALTGAADSLSSGHFHVAEGATLSFGRDRGSAGLATLDGASFSGSGRIQIDANGSPLVDVRLLGSASHAGELRMTSGHFDVDGSLTVASYSSDGGSLQGSGLVRVTGPAVIDGGSLAGSGTTRFAGDLAITGNAQTVWADTRRIETEGTTTWGAGSGGSSLLMNGAVTVVNRGTWIDANQTDVSIGAGSTVAPGKWFINEGRFIKAGTGRTTWSANFVNLGSLGVGAGATMQLSQASFVSEGELYGDGTLQVAGVVNQGRIAPGSSTGTLALTGNLLLAPEGTLSFELASLADFDRLLVGGAVDFGGTLEIVALGYTPVVGDSLVVMTFAQRSGSAGFEQISWLGFGSGVVFDAVLGDQDLTLRVTAVPEPAGWMLGLAGLAGLSGVAARRRRRAG